MTRRLRRLEPLDPEAIHINEGMFETERNWTATRSGRPTIQSDLALFV